MSTIIENRLQELFGPSWQAMDSERRAALSLVVDAISSAMASGIATAVNERNG